MTIDELSNNLDKVISDYESEAGKACTYCCDDATGEAFSTSRTATARALSRFKAEILAYLTQQNI